MFNQGKLHVQYTDAKDSCKKSNRLKYMMTKGNRSCHINLLNALAFIIALDKYT